MQICKQMAFLGQFKPFSTLIPGYIPQTETQQKTQ